MDQFERSEWKKEESAREFIENADMYVLERRTLFKIIKSFYKYFLMKNIEDGRIRVLELGSGDGRVTQELLKADTSLDGTLIDGSVEMLQHAKNRLRSFPELNYIQIMFQELIKDPEIISNFDFIVSSLAIHHLQREEKQKLFKYIYHHLNGGGFFLNIDVARAPSEDLENWYLTIWREWILENEERLEENELKKELKKSFSYMPDQYKDNPDNYPDKLEAQLDALLSIGFENVDCYYKYGIFSIYGGQKVNRKD